LFVFVLIFIAFWRISKQRRRTLAIQSKLKGEREERQRLAHDLHDRVGSMLTAMRLTLEQDKKEDTLEMLSQTSTELRKVAHHLMPESLSRKGLHVALSDYCSVLPDVTFHYFGEPHRLSEEIEVLCYSMIHELINNALRHASATRIQVQLMYESDCISAIVADNGKGFDVNAPHQGIGLSNIRQRIAIHNGRLSVT
jgi:signal transduction histidine kinase